MEEFDQARRADTMQETDRKCPKCGATLVFDPKTGGLYCAYCDYKEEIKQEPAKEGPAEEIDLFSEQNVEGFDWGAKKKVVICESCGAEALYDELQLAEVCPYCGSNHVMQASEDVKTLAPGGVVPFLITAAQAGERFQKWIKRKWFCPKKAKDRAKPEAFKGFYLPYWTFDSNTTSPYTARYGYNRTRTNSKGESETYTEWHNTNGVFTHFYDDVLVQATKRYDASLLGSIEPYDTGDNKAYKPEYIAGFVAERYSVGLKDAWATATRKINTLIENGIRDEVQNRFHADTVDSVRFSTTHSKPSYKYLMLPLWMSAFQYKQKSYHFMVNGQTGKVGGKTPISVPKVILTVVICIAVAVLLWLLFTSGGSAS